MNPRSVRYAIAACAGLAAPALMIAAKGTLAAVLRPPSVRIASFLDPTHVHRDLVTMSLDVLVAAALGVALGAMVTRVTAPQLWRGWCVFIVAFLACSTLMIVLRGEHGRMLAILSQPIFASFIVGTLLGRGLGGLGARRGAR
jgi:Fe2+ transport system protein B